MDIYTMFVSWIYLVTLDSLIHTHIHSHSFPLILLSYENEEGTFRTYAPTAGWGCSLHQKQQRRNRSV